MEKKIIAYKGFDKNLKCRDFQYEVGKEYEKYGDIDVVVEETDWTGVERYHDEIFKVENTMYNGSVAVALKNS